MATQTSDSEMTGDAGAEARANRNGDPCPSWCATDHGGLLVTGQPSFGYLNGHASDPMTGQLLPAADVRVRRSGLAGEGTRVFVAHCGIPALSIAPDTAETLAALLESLAGSKADVEQLADELRAAAAIALDSQ